MTARESLFDHVRQDALDYIETNPDDHAARLLAALLSEVDAMRSHVIALGRPDLAGEPFPDPKPMRVPIENLPEGCEAHVLACPGIDEKTLAALREVFLRAYERRDAAGDTPRKSGEPLTFRGSFQAVR